MIRPRLSGSGQRGASRRTSLERPEARAGVTWRGGPTAVAWQPRAGVAPKQPADRVCLRLRPGPKASRGHGQRRGVDGSSYRFAFVSTNP